MVGEKREILAQLADRLWRETVLHDEIAADENRDVPPVFQTQIRIGIDVDLVVGNVQRTQLRCHLFAEMAGAAAVQLSPCQ